jgi:flavin reductase (DIM6/NTAB) family NADH-FMN oxidoreductase RutF
MAKKSLGASTILVPTPAWIIGTYDSDGRPNGMTVAWAGICCSDPPSVAISLRKATYTYRCILERKQFTISIGHEKHAKEIDYFGLVSGEDVDKFAATKLTPVHSDLVDAPYVEEFPLVLECQVTHTQEIGLHTQFIARILDVKAEADVLSEDGSLDIEKVRPIIFTPSQSTYHGIGARLGHAFSLGKKISI